MGFLFLVNCVTHAMKLENIFKDGIAYFGLALPYDAELITKAKKLQGKWNPELKIWLFKSNPETKKSLATNFELNIPPSGAKSTHSVPQAYIDLLERRRYSQNTIHTYVSLFEQFLRYFDKTKPQDLTDQHVAEFQRYLVKTKRVSTSTQNQYINAIKFYFEKVLGRDKAFYHIERPVKEFKLPKVLSEKEVTAILNAVYNLTRIMQ